MDKVKNFLNDFASGWTFLFAAIYGAVAMSIGLFAVIHDFCINAFNFHEKIIFFQICLTFIGTCLGTTAIIAFVSFIILLLTQTPISKILKIFIIVSLLILFWIFCLPYINCYGGGLLLVLSCFIFGLPVTICFFILPLCILFILECLHKIKPPKFTFQNKILPCIFIIYNILCLIYVICLFL